MKRPLRLFCRRSLTAIARETLASVSRHPRTTIVRGLPALESIIADSHARASDPNATLFSLAAFYLHSISRRKPFTAGNAVIAMVTAAGLIHLNGFTFTAGDAASTTHLEGVILGSISQTDSSQWFADNFDSPS